MNNSSAQRIKCCLPEKYEYNQQVSKELISNYMPQN